MYINYFDLSGSPQIPPRSRFKQITKQSCAVKWLLQQLFKHFGTAGFLHGIVVKDGKINHCGIAANAECSILNAECIM
jgi:hypothetical protein